MSIVRGIKNARYSMMRSEPTVKDVLDADREYSHVRVLEWQHGPVNQSGTLVRAGMGWLQVAPVAIEMSVCVEFHDGLPPDDGKAWTDVAETPYLSRSGVVQLNDDAFDEVGQRLALDGPGLYRVKILTELGDEVVWCLQFWRVDGPVELPR